MTIANQWPYDLMTDMLPIHRPTSQLYLHRMRGFIKRHTCTQIWWSDHTCASCPTTAHFMTHRAIEKTCQQENRLACNTIPVLDITPISSRAMASSGMSGRLAQ